MPTKAYFSALASVAALGIPLCFASPAQAGTEFSFVLDNANSDVGAYPSPYALVDVVLNNSTNATITFTGLSHDGYTYLFAAASAVDVNVNASSWTLGSTITSVQLAGFGTPSYSNGGSGQVDGRGTFNQTINAGNGANPSASVTFSLTDTSGTWADAQSVLALNGNGNYAAAHIFVFSAPASSTAGALKTGYAGGSDSNFPTPPPCVINCNYTSAPEPSSMLLFGAGLLGLGAAVRQRRGT